MMQERPPASSWLPTLGLLALGAAFTGIFAILNLRADWENRVPEFVALFLLSGALYVAAVYLVTRFTFGRGALLFILACAVACRALVLPLRPSLSTDVYRYQWEGRVQRARLNPYKVYPAAPDLRWLQDPQHPIATGTTTPTIYPPLSERVFSWVETIGGYKRLFTGLDLACLAVILLLLAVLKLPLARVLAYAWNPTVVVSFAMCGHHDSLAILTLLAANLFIIGSRPVLSIAFLALSFLSKFFSALLLPLFLKRTRAGYAGIFAGLVVLAYLPYSSAGLQLLGGLSDYAVGWEANDSLFRLIRLAGNSKAQAELAVGVMVVALAIYAAKKRMEPLRASLFLIAALLLLSPNAFPWYFTWTIPFLCFYTSPAWLLMSVTCVLGYAPVVAYAAGQPYRDSPFMLTLEYLPVFALLAYGGWRSMNGERARL